MLWEFLRTVCKKKQKPMKEWDLPAGLKDWKPRLWSCCFKNKTVSVAEQPNSITVNMEKVE